MSPRGLDPNRGLPEPLPPGETVLWQGAPAWRSLAVRAFHIRTVALYFAALLAWRAGAAVTDGASLAQALGSALSAAPIAVAGLALLALFAWLVGRTTIYTITSRRVVIRFGMALPMSVNLPFGMIGSAALKTYPDGSGDIPLAVTGEKTMPYVLLWPHARPWRLSRAEPMLRAVPDAHRVAEVLGRALADAAPVAASPPLRHPAEHAEPVAGARLASAA
jgi:hypothetical protein